MATSLTSGISVVVPVYNSELTLTELHGRLVRALGEFQPFEILFVEDGSRDRSWDVVDSLARQDARVTGVRMMRNYGQHNALLCGIREARYSTIVTMDDDLQNPPEEVTKLTDRLAEGFDVVYGVPERETHGFPRDMASRVTKFALQTAMGAEAARNVSAFRAFRTELRAAFEAYNGPYVSIDVLLGWTTRRFGAVRVRHEPRTAGQSNYNLSKLVIHAMNMMTGYSVVPLKFASIAGFALTGFGILVFFYVVIRYLITPDVAPGFPFLASIIAIFSGAQLFAIGIMGEYIGRIHLRTMDRPSYAIRTTTRANVKDASESAL